MSRSGEIRVSVVNAASYQHHHQRAAALGPWLKYDNWRRPHSPRGHKPLASRLTQAANAPGISS
jgi:transposase InsO family protein